MSGTLVFSNDIGEAFGWGTTATQIIAARL
jgi:hypothetical protein